MTDEGKVYAFGSNYYGCLGLEEEDDTVLSPVPLPFFSSNPVEEISCGENHVAALTKDGEVYTWGCGEFGKIYWYSTLGYGNKKISVGKKRSIWS